MASTRSSSRAKATSGCVRASVVEAASHRYRVQVVEECCFDRHEATHAMNLFDMHQKYADVIPVNDAVGRPVALPRAREGEGAGAGLKAH